MIATPVYLNDSLESQEEYEERLYNDLKKSNEIIKEKMGYESISIAYPYGDFSEDTVRIAKKAGYKMGFSVRQGMVMRGAAPFELNRITADGSYSGKELIEVIESY